MRFSTLSYSTSALLSLLTACADDSLPNMAQEAKGAFGQASDAASAADESAPDAGTDTAPRTDTVDKLESESGATARPLGVRGTAALRGDVAAPAGGLVGLAFSHAGAGMSFLDGDFAGALPGQFTLDVSAAPPQRAQWSAARAQLLAGSDAFALGRLAILPAMHPDTLIIADDVRYAERDSFAACAADPACDHVEQWCVSDGTPRCRTVGLGTCDDGDCAPLHSEGDSAIQLNDDTPGVYSALSENVLVLWSRDGIATSSLVAHFLGLTQDVAAGYALIEVGDVRGEDGAPLADGECAGDECAELYESEGLARYNTLHGTSYVSSEALEGALSEEDGRAARLEVQVRALEAAVAEGVDIAGYTSARVVAAGADVAVQFAADVRNVL